MTKSPDNPQHELEGQRPTLAQPAASAAAAPELGTEHAAGMAEHGLRTRAGEPDLAAGATRSPVDATRHFETAQGRLSYAELAEQLAAPLQAIDLDIRRGAYVQWPLDEALLLSLHAALSRDLFPDEAGRYRVKPVQVGAHLPPDPPQVPQRMRDYILNLGARIEHLTGNADELLLECLAYAEGELLSIHPFPDLNGRISRVWLTEILRRLQLPPVDVVPPGAAFRVRYLAALAAADLRDWKPLIALWKERLSQAAGLHEIELPGCTPTPLASYLKALSVLRLLAEAGDEGGGDSQVTGFWRCDVFVLRSRLSQEQLCRFFLERYRPTPLIAPWNGGSGFYENDNKIAIDAIASSIAQRLESYRSTIELGRSVVFGLGLVESPRQDAKSVLLTTLRNVASDNFLWWMDAAVNLSHDGLRYPPLLGTGGNDGRLDFTNNFMQRVASVVDMRSGQPLVGADAALQTAFFGVPTDSLSHSPIGQFAPGFAGGPNSASGFEGDACINPWDYVLMLEGAILFAASASRRLESADPSVLIAPFTVRSRAGTVGNASAGDDANARGEIWMPLWSAPCDFAELRCLLTEGRAAVNARPSRDGLDFARAVAQLGVDRGIGHFQRFGFLMRSGKAFLATPLNRIAVRRNPEADLIADLERHNWLAMVQRHARDDNAPHAFRSAARRLDDALFALTQQSSREALQTVLRQVGRIDAALQSSSKSREAVRAPAPRLSTEWAVKADDASTEFSIAGALAGLSVRGADGSAALHARRHLVAVGETMNRHGDRKWDPDSRLNTWGAGSLPANLAALLKRRQLEAARHAAEAQLLSSDAGATRQDLAAFLQQGVDDRRIGELLAGLACVDLRRFVTRASRRTDEQHVALPPAFSILKVFFTPETVLRWCKWLPEDRSLHLHAEMPARLASNDVQAAVSLAWQRLRALGVALPGRDPPYVIGVDGPRWLAALCVPLADGEVARMLRSLGLQPEVGRESESETQFELATQIDIRSPTAA